MPFPDILTVNLGNAIQPVCQGADIPCLVLDPTHEGPAAIPPMFWQPPGKSIVYGSFYRYAPFGQVFSHIAACTFLDPLKVTGCGAFVPFDVDHATECEVPYAVVVFGGDGIAANCRYTYEDAVNMGYWQAGFLVSFLLNLRNGDSFTAQTLFLERTPDTETIVLDDLTPALMEYPHLLHWERRDGAGRENAPGLTAELFKQISAIAYHPFSVGRNPRGALGSSGFCDSLDSFSDIPF